MLAFGHNSIGTLIGVGAILYLPDSLSPAQKIVITFVFAVISHYLTDRIPHGHYAFTPPHLTTKMKAMFVLDFAGSMLLLGGLALWQFGLSAEFFVVLAGMWGAQLPDIFEGIISVGIIPFTNFAKKHRHFHFVTMHAVTPRTLTLPDGVSRMWTRIDMWQISSAVLAVIALWLAK